MNAAQTSTIEYLRTEILKSDGLDNSDYEYKIWEIDADYERLVFLTTEVGLIGDEGTLAETIARTHRLISIGPKGGCTLLNGKTLDPKTHSKVKGGKVTWWLTR